ncbi:MAG TPA: SIR2 family protein [Pseudomonadota bacterium]|nr:SIR2 family protein [Pseudomonadota bacterium]
MHDRIYRKLFDLALADHADGSTNVPAAVKKLAHLGAIGNPIVSFNIESASAIALSKATAPILAKTYVKNAEHELAYQFDTTRPKPLARKVLLPHGCLEMAGCVLTDAEYTAHESSMAFQVATHQAYASDLFIVGMSLADEYLQVQIEKFREWIRKIYWIQTDGSTANEKIANRCDMIFVNPGSWPTFWDCFDKPLNSELTPKPEDLYKVWWKLVTDAWEQLGQPNMDMANSYDPSHKSPESQEYMNYAMEAGEGRPRRPLMSDEITKLTDYCKSLLRKFGT